MHGLEKKDSEKSSSNNNNASYLNITSARPKKFSAFRRNRDVKKPKILKN